MTEQNEEVVEERKDVRKTFRSVLEAIPTEFTYRIKFLESEEFEDIKDKLEPLIDDLTAHKKSFFYRRKRYVDIGSEVEITKFMKFIHDIMVLFGEQDKELERILSES